MGEFAGGLKLLKSVDSYLPKPKSGAGYRPSEYIFPLILMLNGGGRSLEDTRQIRTDEALREILPLNKDILNRCYWRLVEEDWAKWRP